ncbi:MAG: hypothetical protein AB1598_05355 [Thermodesulfobacteriota bacterium]
MPSVADLTDEDSLLKLSSSSNFRLGQEIAESGGVELVEFGPVKVVAEVTPPGGVKRTVTLFLSGQRLGWKCTCMSRVDVFCKHCIAAGIVTRQNAPERR